MSESRAGNVERGDLWPVHPASSVGPTQLTRALLLFQKLAMKVVCALLAVVSVATAAPAPQVSGRNKTFIVPILFVYTYIVMSDNIGSAYYNQNEYIVFFELLFFLIRTKHIANNFEVGICTKSEMDY